MWHNPKKVASILLGLEPMLSSKTRDLIVPGPLCYSEADTMLEFALSLRMPAKNIWGLYRWPSKDDQLGTC